MKENSMELMIFHTQNFSNPTQMLGQRQMMDEVKGKDTVDLLWVEREKEALLGEGREEAEVKIQANPK